MQFPQAEIAEGRTRGIGAPLTFTCRKVWEWTDVEYRVG
jgi:hypothetical protein